MNEVNLAKEEDPQSVFIASDLCPRDEAELIALLQEFKDCFACKYSDLNGVPLEANIPSPL